MSIDIKKFSRINKNTASLIPAVDANALEIAINASTFASAWWEYNDETNEKFLIISYSRFAMNGGGIHVGTEEFSITLPCHKKTTFGITDIPYSISEDVIFLSQLITSEITIDAPDESEIDEEDDGEFLGYTKPDEDFAYQELLSSIELALKNLPEAKYIDGKWILE